MSKKIILMLLALSGAASTLKAQTEKGNQLLGGSIGFSTGKSITEYTSSSANANYGGTQKSTNFSIGPNYSFFVANNLDLGANILYSYQNSNFTDVSSNTFNPDKGNMQAFSAMVYLRKYFLYEGKIGLRTGPYASFAYNRTVLEYPNTSGRVYNGPLTGKNTDAGIGLDFVYFPYKKLGMAASIGSLNYTNYDSKDPQNGINTKSNTFGFNVFSGINFSAFFVFGK